MLDRSGRRIVIARDEVRAYEESIRKAERDRIVFGLLRLLSRAPCLVMPGDSEAERESVPWDELMDALKQVSRTPGHDAAPRGQQL
jgi:hypothetical protein